MKNINVEANKSYYHGFVINEQELRRFKDLIVEQLKKDSDLEHSLKFLITFKNGVVAETEDINIVLSQENSGSSEIIELGVIGESKERLIRIRFTNTDLDNASTDITIKYNISGNSRDWVFITSSILEERIKKIKRVAIDFTSRKRKSIFARLLIPLVMFVLMIVMLLSLNPSGYKSDKLSLLNSIEKEWKSGKISDPIEVILKLEKSKYENNDINILGSEVLPVIIIGVILILILVLGGIYTSKCYPLFNFCWGDYLERFKKKESLRKTVNTVIIIGLIVSIVGGVIANLIGK